VAKRFNIYSETEIAVRTCWGAKSRARATPSMVSPLVESATRLYYIQQGMIMIDFFLYKGGITDGE
jgi:hypothetical protein